MPLALVVFVDAGDLNADEFGTTERSGKADHQQGSVSESGEGLEHPSQLAGRLTITAADATWVRTPLLNLTAIGDRLGVSGQRAAQLAHDHPLFPAPVEADKPLYEQAAVEAFADVWERKTGRAAGNPVPIST